MPIHAGDASQHGVSRRLIGSTHLSGGLEYRSYQQNLFKNLCISARQNPQAVDAIAVFVAMPKLGRLHVVAMPVMGRLRFTHAPPVRRSSFANA
ncbi:hypothetical protein [Paraburkholderia fynbosensis]|uniref:hypothetical protein n=1 Tax=Paraburkholderia fynbosensis TaxID=1200993 RepID=UPI0015834DC0|nr:hypothetical protein [Paraburkholderia fynbosensis]